jgi:hypothetical protein
MSDKKQSKPSRERSSSYETKVVRRDDDLIKSTTPNIGSVDWSAVQKPSGSAIKPATSKK